MTDYADLLREMHDRDDRPFMAAAADAIESLQAECERLRAQKGVAEGMIEHLNAELSVWKSVFPDIAPEQVQPDRSALHAELERLREELSAAQQRLDAVREIYAGMDGFIPQTAAEAYCLRIIREMAYVAMAQEKRDE